ncbi:TetR family transcriptional regulator [Porphyromonas sp. HMSC077F02]|uniref:TetR/AcrR family transcriptional regulator n=1 Tax=Porphyromonas sp. HMSC077F02 TaxID=1739529 RepID=UPI0008A1E2C0|nr:TetR/AcrR family transcriptional regulator [Porphyromonas sp. HMSC077F02]OFO51166.1 TetR family transcriptional regulator [Porphyromonas sp. HMSC077F02]
MISKSEERRNQILVGAFKLFLVKEYADVTTADLEEIIGLSRGAIYYKVKNKEGLYRAVIDKFVFELLSNSLEREELASNEKPFLSFIMNELNHTKERMNSVRNSLIYVNSTEYINLLSSAKFHYEGFNDRCKALDQEITQLWLTYYEKGLSAGELNQSIDPPLVVSMFRSLYYGDSFIQSITGNELDIEELKNKHLLLYNSIRL